MQAVVQDTRPRPVLNARQREKLAREISSPRRRTMFETWAWSPITAYRIGLTLSYFAVGYVGVSAAVAGIPVFDLTAPSGWNVLWGVVVTGAAALAAIGSITDRLRWLETIGASLTFAMLVSYASALLVVAYGAGDANRAAVGAVVLALGLQPGMRLLWLLSQLGRRR